MQITKKEIRATFAEWHRKWLKNPEEFDDKGDCSPKEYGEDAGDYFVVVLKDVRKKSKPSMQRSIKKGK